MSPSCSAKRWKTSPRLWRWEEKKGRFSFCLTKKGTENQRGEGENVMMGRICMKDSARALAECLKRVIRQEEGECVWKRELKIVLVSLKTSWKEWERKREEERGITSAASGRKTNRGTGSHVCARLNGKWSASRACILFALTYSSMCMWMCACCFFFIP